MASKSKIAMSLRPPKFSTRLVRRCQDLRTAPGRLSQVRHLQDLFS